MAGLVHRVISFKGIFYGIPFKNNLKENTLTFGLTSVCIKTIEFNLN